MSKLKLVLAGLVVALTMASCGVFGGGSDATAIEEWFVENEGMSQVVAQCFGQAMSDFDVSTADLDAANAAEEFADVPDNVQEASIAAVEQCESVAEEAEEAESAAAMGDIGPCTLRTVEDDFYVDLQVTNSTDGPSNYSISVAYLDDTGVRFDDGIVSAYAVDPGATVAETERQFIDDTPASCEVTDVSRRDVDALADMAVSCTIVPPEFGDRVNTEIELTNNGETQSLWVLVAVLDAAGTRIDSVRIFVDDLPNGQTARETANGDVPAAGAGSCLVLAVE